MASASALFTLCLLLLVHFSSPSSAQSQSFCSTTLSRPTCIDLPTYDKFDVLTYGGRWFEIGNTANFKNLQEAGGICVSANYTLLTPPSPGKGATIRVVNTLYGLGSPSHNVSQVVISLSAGQICGQAFSICAEADKESSNSSLWQGLSLVSGVASALKKGGHTGPAGALAVQENKIHGAVLTIDELLDGLARDVSEIQVLDSQLGQGLGNATENVAALVGEIEKANETVIAVGELVGKIGAAGNEVRKVAANLTGQEDSAKLCKAVELISAGLTAINSEVAQIQASLAGMLGVSGIFLSPSTAPKAYSGIVGESVQNSSFAGKLAVTFSGHPLGEYWVLAVEESKGIAGYSAVIIYSCNQNSEGGGVVETLFILSRTPTLPAASVKRLLAKAAGLDVHPGCSTPFVYTVQSESCGTLPPSLFSQ